VQEIQVRLKLNGIHKLLAYADNVHLLGDNIGTIKKNRKTVISPEVNLEKTKYMLLSHHQNVCQSKDTKIADISFENVSKFNYLGTTVTNQNLIQEEIKGRLNSGNVATIWSRTFCLFVCDRKM
jgi:hypothetical protein